MSKMETLIGDASTTVCTLDSNERLLYIGLRLPPVTLPLIIQLSYFKAASALGIVHQ